MDDLRPERSPRALTRGLRSVVTQPVRSGRNCLGYGGPSIGAEDFEVNVRLRHVEFVEAAANRLHERRRAAEVDLRVGVDGHLGEVDEALVDGLGGGPGTEPLVP